MAFDLDRIKLDNPIAVVIGKSLALKPSGSEFVALCPFHGEKTPSFTIEPGKGLFKCFGCGEFGDVIDFTRKLHNVDLKRACEMLGAVDDPDADHRPLPNMMKPQPNRVPAFAPIMPVPDDVPAPPAAHATLGKPDHIARVLNQAGELCYLIYRFEPKTAEDRKQIRPLAFDGKVWQWKGPPAPRPLYGLPLTVGLPVLLVEGEKKRDAAAEALAGLFDVVSWPNGAEAVPQADWSLLAGLDVTMWPDAGTAGRAAAARVTERLQPIASRFRITTVLPNLADNWDVADALADGWDQQSLLAYIGHAVAPRDPNHEPPEPDPYDPGPTPPPDTLEPEDAPRRTRRQASGEIHWGEPVDFIGGDELGAPELQPHQVPAAIYPFVKDIAGRMGVDPTGVAMACLVTCASVIDDDFKLQPRRHDTSWTESARLWAAILGGPSTIKTPQINACTRPVEKLDVEARKRHSHDMRTYRNALAAHKKAVKAGDDSEEPRMPRLDRYLVEGTTIEALQNVLRDDDDATMHAPAHKVLSKHDEMSEFFANLDRYKAGGSGGGDRGAYLRLYNGGRYTMDRVGRGAFSVPHWSACMIGGCQPGPIQRIARETADDGLLQRFIWCVSDRQEPGIDRTPDYAASARYEGLIPTLSAMHPAKPAFGEGHLRPIVLHAEAHVLREEIDALARAFAAMPDVSKRMQSAFGKWGGLFGRLALTFHMIEQADAKGQNLLPAPIGVVSVATVERVSAFMQEIVLPHLQRAERMMFQSTQAGHAQWIAGLILSKGKGFDRITTRDVTRAYTALRSPEAAQELMQVMNSLVAVGWLEPEQSPNPAKATHAWAINPAIHTVFAARAEKERLARSEAKETEARDMQTLAKKRKSKEQQP